MPWQKHVTAGHSCSVHVSALQLLTIMWQLNKTQGYFNSKTLQIEANLTTIGGYFDRRRVEIGETRPQGWN